MDRRFFAPKAEIFALIALAGFVIIGCQGSPVPLTVAAGSTMMVPVDTGVFGSQVATANGRPDYYRGDLVFALCPTSNPSCSPPLYYLTTTYVTSVVPHPASPAAIRGYLNGYAYGGQHTRIAGQSIALVDVPANVAANTYALSVRTRPYGSPQGQNEAMAFSQPVNIKVTAATSAPYSFSDTMLRYGINNFPGDAAQDLADLIPYPTLVVRLSNEFERTAFPAAGEVQITYPAGITIKTVYEDKHPGRSSIVQYSVDSASRVIKAQFVDPTRCTTALRIAYERIPPQNPNDPVVIVYPESFTITSQQTYNLNGVALSGNSLEMGWAGQSPADFCGI